MMIINDHSIFIISVCVTPVITKNGPDHLSDLKAVVDSIFLSESKYYSTFLHPVLACHPFH